MKILLVAILILASQLPPANATIADILKLIKVSKDIATVFKGVWKTLNGQVNHQNSLVISEDMEQKLAAIDDHLRSMEAASEYRTRGISESINRLPGVIRLNFQLDRLLDLTTQISIKYENMRRYSNDNQFERFTLEDFARKIVSNDDGSASDLTGRIHAFIASTSQGITDTSIFGNLVNSLQDNGVSFSCDLGQSPQQIIYQLYYAIALAEFRGNAMLQFSYMLLKLHNKGNFTREVELAEELYQTRSEQAIRLAYQSMQRASKELWRCDPNRHVYKNTYLKLTHLMQGFILKETDLSAKNSCRKKCSHYGYVDAYEKGIEGCMGTLHQCSEIKPAVSICEAETSSDRRYEFVKNKKTGNRVYGLQKQCSTRWLNFAGWQRGFVRCSTCFCFCDEKIDGRSVKYFSMKPVYADVENNMVVTGVKFTEHNKIIYLQIQEGKLLADGVIDQSTVRWVPVEEGENYYTVTRENNAMDLDDLYTTEGQLVTGVRFRQLGNHLNLQIYESHFDLTNGKLVNLLTNMKFEDNDNTLSRQKLNLDDSDEPIRTELPSIPDSAPNQYVTFQHSSVNKDVAQSAVPFLDAQPVKSVVPVALSGIGIFHKGRPGYGGFVALKIMTYDFSHNMATTMEFLKNEG